LSNFQLKPNTGTVFANDRKEKDTDPSGKGEALIDGVEYWISSWVNTSKKSGEKYRKLMFTRKDNQQGGGSRTSDNASQDDGEVPF